MRGGFWHLGAKLLSFAYAGTVLDPKAKTHGGDSEEDNFDLIMQSAEKIYILRPVLRPATLALIQTEMSKYCTQVLNDVMKTFHRAKEELQEDPEEAAPTKDDSAILPWLQNFSAPSQMPTPISGDEESLTSAAPGKKIVLSEKPIARRRLQRQISDFDKSTKMWMPRNALRTEMIGKACSIFDYIVDAGNKLAKVSSVLSHLTDYEREWGRFPKDPHMASTMGVDKLTIAALGFQSL